MLQKEDSSQGGNADQSIQDKALSFKTTSRVSTWNHQQEQLVFTKTLIILYWSDHHP